MTRTFFSGVAAIGFEVILGDIDQNVARMRASLAELKPEQGSVVVLPELWAHGFDYRHGESLAS
ncbi:MAG: hypothetical protein OEV64_15525, partial [Desulfobulbaceae bacterium]|nr:hypothetical protein [Desulfobulbaceae bacterium]